MVSSRQKKVSGTIFGQRNGEKRFLTPFVTRQGRLPTKPYGYYTEYVHPTPGESGPGGQRIVTGKGGETYYSPDHYRTFIPVKPPE
jgi:guanyl-specific ribonuclease Sa